MKHDLSPLVLTSAGCYFGHRICLIPPACHKFNFFVNRSINWSSKIFFSMHVHVSGKTTPSYLYERDERGINLVYGSTKLEGLPFTRSNGTYLVCQRRMTRSTYGYGEEEWKKARIFSEMHGRRWKTNSDGIVCLGSFNTSE